MGQEREGEGTHRTRERVGARPGNMRTGSWRCPGCGARPEDFTPAALLVGEDGVPICPVCMVAMVPLQGSWRGAHGRDERE